MLRESRIQTVVLTVQYSTRSSYYIDWLDAFRFASQFEARSFNVFKQSQRRAAAAAIEKAELIVALHACSADTLDYIKPLSGALNSRRGKFPDAGRQRVQPALGRARRKACISAAGPR